MVPLFLQCPTEPQPLALSVEDGAHLIGLRNSKMWEVISAGLVIPIRLGRRTLIPYAELQKLLARPQPEIDAALTAFKANRGAR